MQVVISFKFDEFVIPKHIVIRNVRLNKLHSKVLTALKKIVKLLEIFSIFEFLSE